MENDLNMEKIRKKKVGFRTKDLKRPYTLYSQNLFIRYLQYVLIIHCIIILIININININGR